jgi:uncharacterized protein
MCFAASSDSLTQKHSCRTTGTAQNQERRTDMNGAQLVSSGMWQWLQGTGLERFELVHNHAQWKLRGTIVAFAGDAAAEARYEITCDAGWRTGHAQVWLISEGREQTLEIRAEGGQWFANGREIESVRGAADIDLGWSPSTNTLPIRRLNLGPGEKSGEIVAAWVRFPELALEPLRQEYVRLSERTYRYSSRGGAFTAELLVDENGLVVEYGGFWKRVQG